MLLRNLICASPILAVLPVLMCGCGGSDGPEFVPVSGKVTFDGEPVTEGTIMFLNTATQDSRQADLAEGGRYELEVTKGTHQVAIEPIVIEYGGDGNSPPTYDYKKVKNIPNKYRSGATSGFDTTVDGEAVFDFDMKPKTK